MAYRLLGQDCAVTIEDGGAFDGTPTYAGGAAILAVTAFARSISIKEDVSTRDMRGLGNTTKRLRPANDAGHSVELKLLVESTGAIVITLGHYYKVTFKALSSFVSASTYEGIAVSQSVEAPDGEQVQTIVIEGPADQ